MRMKNLGLGKDLSSSVIHFCTDYTYFLYSKTQPSHDKWYILVIGSALFCKPPFLSFFFFFKNIFYWLCYYSCPIFPPHSPPSWTPPPTHIPLFSSCPCVIHISSLATTFPILFLPPPPSIFYLPSMLLILCTFSPLLSPPTPLLITLHVISISVILFLFYLFA